MSPGLRSNALRNERVYRALSYALVFLIMACVALTTSILITSVFPEWHSGILAGVALFVVIDRLYTYRYLKTLTFLSTEWVVAISAQLIIMMLLIRVLLSFANGLNTLRTDLSLIARGDLDQLVTPEYVIYLLLALVVWILSRQFLDLIDEIGLEQAIALSEESGPIEMNVVPPHRRMVNLVLTLGIALVILTAMSRMNLRTMVSTSGQLPGVEFSRFSGAEAGALLYFVFGLALLSLTRLMSLQTHWNRMRISISSANLARQWGIYSLCFLLALAVFVSLLPSGDSFGFLSLVGTLLAFLFQVLLFILQLVIGLILLLFSLPFLLFNIAPPALSNAPPPPMPVLPTQPISPATNNEMLALIRSIFLWGSLVVILVFAFIHFVRQHDDILPALRKFRITNWLVLAWQWVYRNVDRTGENLSRVILEGWQSIASRLERKRFLPPTGWISLRSLDPRRQIYFYYLAMVRRGGESGLARKPSQTPSEYTTTLEEAIPFEREDIILLTDAFMEARYSRREMDRQKANRVKETWGRIRRALQSKSKRDSSEGK